MSYGSSSSSASDESSQLGAPYDDESQLGSPDLSKRLLLLFEGQISIMEHEIARRVPDLPYHARCLEALNRLKRVDRQDPDPVTRKRIVEVRRQLPSDFPWWSPRQSAYGCLVAAYANLQEDVSACYAVHLRDEDLVRITCASLEDFIRFLHKFRLLQSACEDLEQ